MPNIILLLHKVNTEPRPGRQKAVYADPQIKGLVEQGSGGFKGGTGIIKPG